jgi:wyosine [tRNA(Phe)-imidazoG37] synthetase (radical SAM superfamily)
MHQAGRINSNKMAAAWRSHERLWRDNNYVYAVISRRSRGISVGINLNPDKSCNFDCVYCQVNRTAPPVARSVDLEAVSGELDRILKAERDGSLYEDAPFNILLPGERGIRDLAFSGDGEPTAFPRFEEAVTIAANARQRFGLDSTRLTLLTNAAFLDKPGVRAALALMDCNNGEIWAKLDAGTESYFRRVNRAHVSLEKILENILNAARIRPLVLQSLWFRIEGIAPPFNEIEAYCTRVNDILSSGGRLKNIQLYTIARNPAYANASPLADDELNQIGSLVRASVQVPLEIYTGS